MEAEEHSKQLLFDIEASPVTADGSSKEHLRQLGMSELDAVLTKAKAGADPWEFQQQPKRVRDLADDTAEHDADVAAMGAWLERNRPLLLAAGFVVAQGGSWVLMKGSLLSMHTPAVLTFLHLLAAAALQLALVANNVLPAPQLSAAAAKGALVPSMVSALQLLLVMGVLEHTSVFLLLCWVLVVPLLLGVTRVADVARKRWLLPLDGKQLPCLAVAAAGLGLEVLLDGSARSAAAYLMLLAWTAVLVLDMVWQQVKVDATLGHLIMEPDFLFRARELGDLEAALSPSSQALLTASLPALPVLALGLVSLEAKDLVDHEPSVPTLEALLLSCLAFAAVHNLRAMMAGCTSLRHNHTLLLQSGAAVVAVVLELLERSTSGSGKLCLLAVGLSIGGCFCSQVSSTSRLQ